MVIAIDVQKSNPKMKKKITNAIRQTTLENVYFSISLMLLHINFSSFDNVLFTLSVLMLLF